MSAVIDAAALMAFLLDERGSDAAIPMLRASMMSAVNLSECCARAPERGASVPAVLQSIRRFEMTIVPFDYDQAIGAANLRESTRHVGASFGDRACLQLARSRDVSVYTADRRLAELDIGIDIRLIR